MSTIAGLDYWTGLLDWTTGLDYWTTGLDYLMLIIRPSPLPASEVRAAVYLAHARSANLFHLLMLLLILRVRNLEPRVTGFVDGKRRTVRRPPKSLSIQVCPS